MTVRAVARVTDEANVNVQRNRHSIEQEDQKTRGSQQRFLISVLVGAVYVTVAFYIET